MAGRELQQPICSIYFKGANRFSALTAANPRMLRCIII
jgi:hypothetical protein